MGPKTGTFIAFAILLTLLGLTAGIERQPLRIVFAGLSLLWILFLYPVAQMTANFNNNVWYSNATAEMLDTCIEGIEKGNQDRVLTEMKDMRKNLGVTY